jgi:hypothetical protein
MVILHFSDILGKSEKQATASTTCPIEPFIYLLVPSEILFNDTTELIRFSPSARDMGAVWPCGHVGPHDHSWRSEIYHLDFRIFLKNTLFDVQPKSVAKVL